jgi:membrane-associated PAP2 superfamily phosphatase
MRFINMYLVGYFVLLIGALAALWYGGVLRNVSPAWVVIGLVIAVGLGIMLSVSGGKPEITRE